jgi:hypothetical protein
MTPEPRRPTRRVLGAAAAVAAVATLAAVVVTVARSGASSLPVVRVATARVDVVEGDAGSTAVPVVVGLSTAAPAEVAVDVDTVDGTAKAADGDYVPLHAHLTFAPGEVARTVTVAVTGDTRLEDDQAFGLRLRSVTGAGLGRHAAAVWIRNDETPKVAVGNVRVGEGGVAEFRPHLLQRYVRPVTAVVLTGDRTAAAGGDYAPVFHAVTFPAGSLAAVAEPVATLADTVTEDPETFTLSVGGSEVVNTATAVGTIIESDCPGGAPASAAAPAPAPASPSGPLLTAPPAAVTGGTGWDVVFRDEFDDPTTVARQWDSGMRSGAQTLVDNGELEWYSPGNSVLGTDTDGTRPLSVLQQRVTDDPVAGTYYPVGVLKRLYPPARCPQYYDPAHLADADASRVPYRFRSGMLNSAKSFGFRYGYVEARVRMPKGFGLWPALWLRDWDAWSYEVDALEGFDRDARLLRSTYWWGNAQHHATENDGGDLGLHPDGSPCRGTTPLPATTVDAAECSLATASDLSAGYHTIGLNWTPTGYEVYLDGVKRWTSPEGADVAHAYNHLILNLAVGNDTNEFDWNREVVRPLDALVLQSAAFAKRTVEWDYVRVWQPAGRHDVCTTGSC